jgi:hypothetical protein
LLSNSVPVQLNVTESRSETMDPVTVPLLSHDPAPVVLSPSNLNSTSRPDSPCQVSEYSPSSPLVYLVFSVCFGPQFEVFLLLCGSKVVISPSSFHFESVSDLGFDLFTCGENMMESCFLQSVGPKVVFGLLDSVPFFV